MSVIQSVVPADGMFATRSHARISASPASRAATQKLVDFTGTSIPNWGASRSGAMVEFGVVLGPTPESERWMDARSGRSRRLSPKVLAISAHTILKLEQAAG